MRDLSELGLTPHVKGKQPKLKLAAIRDFEIYFGVILPKEYVQFLLFRNGGSPKLRCYKVQNGVDGRLGRFFYLGEPETQPARPVRDGWDSENLWAETRVRRPLIGTRGVPIASNGGGDIVFLDYTADSPSVAELGGDDRLTRKVAVSFPDFIDSLYF